ncbi:hypothetical protein [Clostridium sp.]|uniref:hypothetical protein n=1 Tax=Clostridium sp. TaxID=1506 RepID=UPI003990D4E5
MKISKYIEYAYTKLKVCYKERKYYKNGYELKYILEKNNSEDLIIIFSSCTRPGIKARYNYNRTLQKVKANKLFILDDFGDDKRGVFYLGCNNDFKIKKITKDLIDKVIKETKSKKITYVGSSKGGYAALLFGLQKENSNIIIGAPQYYLGDYLNRSDNMNTLVNIVGNVTQDKIDYLNEILPRTIEDSKNNNVKLYIHFSSKEHTYEEHIRYLIDDLKRYKYEHKLEVLEYTNHSEVSIYFPKFLLNTIESN